MKDEFTDQYLLAQFCNHQDSKAFQTIVARYAPMLVGVCTRLLNNTHDAQDACQTTFVVLAQKAHTLDASSSLGNWLYGVAIRTAKKMKTSEYRRKQREESYAETHTMTHDDLSKEKNWQQFKDSIDNAIDQLPASLKSVAIAYYLQGLSYEEVSQQLQLNSNTIRGRLERVRKILKKRLKATGVAAASAVPLSTMAQKLTSPLELSTIEALAHEALSETAHTPAYQNALDAHTLLQQELTSSRKSITLSWAAGIAITLLSVSIITLTMWSTSDPQKTPPEANALQANLSHHAAKPSEDSSTHTPLAALPSTLNTKQDIPKPKLEFAAIALSFQKAFLHPDSFEKWSIIQQLGMKLTLEEVTAIAQEAKQFEQFTFRVLKQWTENDPEAVMDWAVGNQLHEVPPSHRGVLTQAWLRTFPETLNHFLPEGVAVQYSMDGTQFRNMRFRFVDKETQERYRKEFRGDGMPLLGIPDTITDVAFHLWARQNPYAALAYAENKMEDSPHREKLIQSIEKRLNPQKRVEIVLQFENKKFSGLKLREIAETWPQESVVDAFYWAQKNIPLAYDRHAFFQGLVPELTRQDFQAAQALLKDVQDFTDSQKFRDKIAAEIAVTLAEKDPQAAIELTEDLNSDIRNDAFSGIIANWARQDMDSALTWMNTLEPEAFDKALPELLSFMPKEHATDTVYELMDKVEDTRMKVSLVKGIRELSAKAPDAASQMLSDFILSKDSFQLNDMKSTLSQSTPNDSEKALQQDLWISVLQITRDLAQSQAPQQAIDWVEKIPYKNPSDRIDMLSNAVSTWSYVNPQAALAWLEQSSLPQSKKKDIKTFLSQHKLATP